MLWLSSWSIQRCFGRFVALNLHELVLYSDTFFYQGGELPIVSLSSEGEVAVWDGLLSQWFLGKRS